MSEIIWSFGEHSYYKFTSRSSANRTFFNFKGGTEVSDGGIFLTSTDLTLGNVSIKLDDIKSYRMIFFLDRRIFELELMAGYPEKYVFIASYRSTKGVMSGSFEMIYLFSYLCKLLPGRHHDYQLNALDVDVKIEFDKPFYSSGDTVLLKLTIGNKIPKLTRDIDVHATSNISTWKVEGVIVHGHSYHQEHTSTHTLGDKCVELSNDKIQKVIELEYQLPIRSIFPILGTHGKPFEITHEISIRYKRRFLQDVFARFIIPYLPNIEIIEPKQVLKSENGITAIIDKDVVYSKDTIEIDVKVEDQFTYDSIRLEFLKKIQYRVYKQDPKKLDREIVMETDTESYIQESDICLFEVSKVDNFPLKLVIPHEVLPSYNLDELVKFNYFIRVVFVRKLAKDHKIDLPITFYPNWKDFKK